MGEKDWDLEYKQNVYSISNGKIDSHIIASGLSMQDAIELKNQSNLFRSIEEARLKMEYEHLEKCLLESVSGKKTLSELSDQLRHSGYNAMMSSDAINEHFMTKTNDQFRWIDSSEKTMNTEVMMSVGNWILICEGLLERENLQPEEVVMPYDEEKITPDEPSTSIFQLPL